MAAAAACVERVAGKERIDSSVVGVVLLKVRLRFRVLRGVDGDAIEMAPVAYVSK
jgi:hypothetical protein